MNIVNWKFFIGNGYSSFCRFLKGRSCPNRRRKEVLDACAFEANHEVDVARLVGANFEKDSCF